MRKSLFITWVFIAWAAAALAQPQMAQTADSEFSFSEGGRLAMRLMDAASGEERDLGAIDVEAGTYALAFDAKWPDGSAIDAGEYELTMRLRNFWGEESEALSLPFFVGESGAAIGEGMTTIGGADGPTAIDVADQGDALDFDTLDLDALDLTEAQLWEEAEPIGEAAQDDGIPAATSFWDMDPDAYDLSNPEHQQAIWALMMQPITVLDVGQTEHVFPTYVPGADKKPWKENCAGELHGQSQGVHVLEEDTDGDGYVLIEAYSNDGTKTENETMKSLDAQLIRGYVKKSLLKTVKPSDKYALLVDKLRQKLYIFEKGTIIGELEISSGLNNAKQPYNESPAGEFITISKTGDFKAGSRTIGRYAIRINGGTLFHEVLHDVAADGTRIYSAYEPQLGKKASHGCIRIQRRENAQGQNMRWLWDNLEMKTRVFIWDDKGRTMKPELPDPTTQLYRNPSNGTNYHLNANCSGVKKQFLPLTGDITYGELMTEAYKKLTPCVYCGAPARPETLLERYEFEAKQIGHTVTDEERAAFGVE